MSASSAPFEWPRAGTVFKSGPLFIPSKGIGWKSWKKRWFILTRMSLVFLKNDPNALPQRGGEVNLTLGGIDLNNSGSVVVREDKKLLTVLFPDGRDGRAFTLKAASSEDLYEWKMALEQALAQAPSAALVVGHNEIFRNDTTDAIEGSFQKWRDKRPIKSLVVGRPVLLALEDIDGGPSFLEKALCFLEKFGTGVEGILRQSADVEEVDRRVREYEQGKSEFGSDEDAHVVGDCVKYVLRELPSSPVPESCCTALLEAYRIERKEAQINAMRSAILDTFPEPNRRLLQRILKMMHIIAAHASENRMTPSAIAACMAPLLLRPLLAGKCELEYDFDINGDPAQLLAAANAANSAQAIVTILLVEYENIFDDDNLHRCSLSVDFLMENSGSEDSVDGENMGLKDNGFHYAENEVDLERNDAHEHVLGGKLSESGGSAVSDLYDYKVFGGDYSDVESPRDSDSSTSNLNQPVDSFKSHTNSSIQFEEQQAIFKGGSENSVIEMVGHSILPEGESHRSMGEIVSLMDPGLPLPVSGPELCAEKPISKLKSSNFNVKCSTFCGRNTTKRDPSMESFDSSGKELAIQRLEITKNDLCNRIAKEAKGNAILLASLERKKQALHERCLALEKDVSRLREQLQAERDLRAALEVGLSMSTGQLSSPHGMDSKTRAELEEIALAEADVVRLKQKVSEVHFQLNQQCQHHYDFLSGACDRYQHVQNLQSQHCMETIECDVQLQALKRMREDDADHMALDFQECKITVSSPRRLFQQDLAFCYREKKHRSEEDSPGADWRNIKGQALASASSSRQLSWKQFMVSNSHNDSSTDVPTGVSVDELSAVDSGTMPSTSGAEEGKDNIEGIRPHPFPILVDLTTALDFFKEPRTQLMEQLHDLSLTNGAASSQSLVYKRSSPPWNSLR